MRAPQIISSQGLITQPNEHGVYEPGALKRALNVCQRDPGVLSSLPDTRSYRDNVISNGYTLRRLWPADSSVLAIGDSGGTWAARWVSSGASNTVTINHSFTYGTGGVSTDGTFATGKAQQPLIRSRRFLTTDNLGPVVLDSEGDTTTRLAGFPPLQPYLNAVTTTNAVAVPADAAVSWRFVWRRKQSDGYETESEPSYAVTLDNPSGGNTVDVTFLTRFGSLTGIPDVAAGDFIEVYRTKKVASGSDPGEEFRLALSYTLTSTDISNGYATLNDVVPEDSLGTLLYTNPAQPSEAGNPASSSPNAPPGLAVDAFVYDGRTFYLETRRANQRKLKITTLWGNLSTTAERTNGVGNRNVTGDTNIGSNVITNVSTTVGVVAGQQIDANSATVFPSGTLVVSKTANSITVDQNATGNTVGATRSVSDVLEVNGVKTPIWTNLNLMFAAYFNYWTVLLDRAVSVNLDTSSNILATTAEYGIEMIFRSARYANGVITLRATNGQNYSPPLPEIGTTAENGTYDERFNRISFSKDQQPEAVPPLNYFYGGAGTNYRGISTEDATFIFASDGLWRMSGAAGEYRVDPISPTLILAARNAVDVLDKRVWAYTNEGLVSIGSAGDIEYVSRGKVGDAANLPGAAYADTWDTYLAADELHHEIWLTFRSGGNSISYVYNTLSGAFTTVDHSNEWSAMCYSRALRSLVIGAVSTNPDVHYFELDTSTTRMAGSDVRFQPIEVDDAFTEKQFISLDWLFRGATTALTLVPSYDGTNYTAATIPASALESRKAIGVPRNAPAVAARIAPGFTLSAGGTSNLWSFRGLSARWSPSSEESHR